MASVKMLDGRGSITDRMSAFLLHTTVAIALLVLVAVAHGDEVNAEGASTATTTPSAPGSLWEKINTEKSSCDLPGRGCPFAAMAWATGTMVPENGEDLPVVAIRNGGLCISVSLCCNYTYKAGIVQVPQQYLRFIRGFVSAPFSRKEVEMMFPVGSAKLSANRNVLTLVSSPVPSFALTSIAVPTARGIKMAPGRSEVDINIPHTVLDCKCPNTLRVQPLLHLAADRLATEWTVVGSGGFCIGPKDLETSDGKTPKLQSKELTLEPTLPLLATAKWSVWSLSASTGVKTFVATNVSAGGSLTVESLSVHARYFIEVDIQLGEAKRFANATLIWRQPFVQLKPRALRLQKWPRPQTELSLPFVLVLGRELTVKAPLRRSELPVGYNGQWSTNPPSDQEVDELNHVQSTANQGHSPFHIGQDWATASFDVVNGTKTDEEEHAVVVTLSKESGSYTRVQWTVGDEDNACPRFALFQLDALHSFPSLIASARPDQDPENRTICADSARVDALPTAMFLNRHITSDWRCLDVTPPTSIAIDGEKSQVPSRLPVASATTDEDASLTLHWASLPHRIKTLQDDFLGNEMIFLQNATSVRCDFFQFYRMFSDNVMANSYGSGREPLEYSEKEKEERELHIKEFSLSLNASVGANLYRVSVPDTESLQVVATTKQRTVKVSAPTRTRGHWHIDTKWSSNNFLEIADKEAFETTLTHQFTAAVETYIFWVTDQPPCRDYALKVSVLISVAPPVVAKVREPVFFTSDSCVTVRAMPHGDDEEGYWSLGHPSSTGTAATAIAEDEKKEMNKSLSWKSQDALDASLCGIARHQRVPVLWTVHNEAGSANDTAEAVRCQDPLIHISSFDPILQAGIEEEEPESTTASEQKLRQRAATYFETVLGRKIYPSPFEKLVEHRHVSITNEAYVVVVWPSDESSGVSLELEQDGRPVNGISISKTFSEDFQQGGHSMQLYRISGLTTGTASLEARVETTLGRPATGACSPARGAITIDSIIARSLVPPVFTTCGKQADLPVPSHRVPPRLMEGLTRGYEEGESRVEMSWTCDDSAVQVVYPRLGEHEVKFSSISVGLTNCTLKTSKVIYQHRSPGESIDVLPKRTVVASVETPVQLHRLEQELPSAVIGTLLSAGETQLQPLDEALSAFNESSEVDTGEELLQAPQPATLVGRTIGLYALREIGTTASGKEKEQMTPRENARALAGDWTIEFVPLRPGISEELYPRLTQDKNVRTTTLVHLRTSGSVAVSFIPTSSGIATCPGERKSIHCKIVVAEVPQDQYTVCGEEQRVTARPLLHPDYIGEWVVDSDITTANRKHLSVYPRVWAGSIPAGSGRRPKAEGAYQSKHAVESLITGLSYGMTVLQWTVRHVQRPSVILHSVQVRVRTVTRNLLIPGHRLVTLQSTISLPRTLSTYSWAIASKPPESEELKAHGGVVVRWAGAGETELVMMSAESDDALPVATDVGSKLVELVGNHSASAELEATLHAREEELPLLTVRNLRPGETVLSYTLQSIDSDVVCRPADPHYELAVEFGHAAIVGNTPMKTECDAVDSKDGVQMTLRLEQRDAKKQSLQFYPNVAYIEETLRGYNSKTDPLWWLLPYSTWSSVRLSADGRTLSFTVKSTMYPPSVSHATKQPFSELRFPEFLIIGLYVRPKNRQQDKPKTTPTPEDSARRSSTGSTQQQEHSLEPYGSSFLVVENEDSFEGVSTFSPKFIGTLPLGVPVHEVSISSGETKFVLELSNLGRSGATSLFPNAFVGAKNITEALLRSLEICGDHFLEKSFMVAEDDLLLGGSKGRHKDHHRKNLAPISPWRKLSGATASCRLASRNSLEISLHPNDGFSLTDNVRLEALVPKTILCGVKDKDSTVMFPATPADEQATGGYAVSDEALKPFVKDQVVSMGKLTIYDDPVVNVNDVSQIRECQIEESKIQLHLLLRGASFRRFTDPVQFRNSLHLRVPVATSNAKKEKPEPFQQLPPGGGLGACLEEMVNGATVTYHTDNQLTLHLGLCPQLNMALPFAIGTQEGETQDQQEADTEEEEGDGSGGSSPLSNETVSQCSSEYCVSDVSSSTTRLKAKARQHRQGFSSSSPSSSHTGTGFGGGSSGSGLPAPTSRRAMLAYRAVPQTLLVTIRNGAVGGAEEEVEMDEGDGGTLQQLPSSPNKRRGGREGDIVHTVVVSPTMGRLFLLHRKRRVPIMNDFICEGTIRLEGFTVGLLLVGDTFVPEVGDGTENGYNAALIHSFFSERSMVSLLERRQENATELRVVSPFLNYLSIISSPRHVVRINDTYIEFQFPPQAAVEEALATQGIAVSPKINAPFAALEEVTFSIPGIAVKCPGCYGSTTTFSVLAEATAHIGFHPHDDPAYFKGWLQDINGYHYASEINEAVNYTAFSKGGPLAYGGNRVPDTLFVRPLCPRLADIEGTAQKKKQNKKTRKNPSRSAASMHAEVVFSDCEFPPTQEGDKEGDKGERHGGNRDQQPRAKKFSRTTWRYALPQKSGAGPPITLVSSDTLGLTDRPERQVELWLESSSAPGDHPQELVSHCNSAEYFLYLCEEESTGTPEADEDNGARSSDGTYGDVDSDELDDDGEGLADDRKAIAPSTYSTQMSTTSIPGYRCRWVARRTIFTKPPPDPTIAREATRKKKVKAQRIVCLLVTAHYLCTAILAFALFQGFGLRWLFFHSTALAQGVAVAVGCVVYQLLSSTFQSAPTSQLMLWGTLWAVALVRHSNLLTLEYFVLHVGLLLFCAFYRP